MWFEVEGVSSRSTLTLQPQIAFFRTRTKIHLVSHYPLLKFLAEFEWGGKRSCCGVKGEGALSGSILELRPPTELSLFKA